MGGYRLGEARSVLGAPQVAGGDLGPDHVHEWMQYGREVSRTSNGESGVMGRAVWRRGC